MAENAVNFPCPHCRERVSAPSKFVGRQVPCPMCRKPLTIPDSSQTGTFAAPDDTPPVRTPPPVEPVGAPQPVGQVQRPQPDDIYEPPPVQTSVGAPQAIGQAPSSQPSVMSPFDPVPATKTCPYCAEQVALQAIKCKHCGSALGGPIGTGPIGAGPTGQAAWSTAPAYPPGIIRTPLLISAIGNIVVALIYISTCFLSFLAIPCIVLCIFEFILYANAESLEPRKFFAKAHSMGIAQVIVGLANTISLVCGIIILTNIRAQQQRYGTVP